jgi:two-component system cell cycle sensor histidine kinase/response regulator CckA
VTERRHLRALVVFVALLFLFLLTEAYLVSAQLQQFLIDDLQKETEANLELMADSAYESILKSDYVTIRTFINRWSEAHDEIVELRALAPNGFTIEEIKRPLPQGAHTLSLSKTVIVGGRELLRLELVASDRGIKIVTGSLRNRLFAGALLFTLILGAALWHALRTMALKPLEHEVTRREYAEAELQRSHDALEDKVRERTTELALREERIHLLLDSAAEGIYGIDTNGNCTFCNPSCLKYLGYAREEDILGRNTHDLFHHHHADGTSYFQAECPIYEAYRSGIGCHSDIDVFWRADGTHFPVEYWSYPIASGGKVLGAVVTFLDRSEHEKLEAQLIQAQKMEAVGTLAGGVAHDFNNILTAIIGYGSILQRKMDAADPLRNNVTHILDSAQRAARLTQSLLTFSRKQIMVPQPVDLNAVVRRVEKLLGQLIGEDVDVSLELCDADLIVHADSGQLEQVLMNLATNARDAMPHGGLLTIHSQRADFAADSARVHGLAAPGGYAVLSVSDTGVGMDEKTRTNIFEPFFTTKEVGRGTGLGLSIAYGIIKQHGGTISVYSEAGKGTTFKINLPLRNRQAVEERPSAGEMAPQGGSETILVAEDDKAVRSLMRTILEESGYRVHEAADGDEAVRIFTDNSSRIGLVLLDTIMPKKNGRQAYEAMKAIQPEVKTLFMSGYTADIISKQGLLDPGIDLLHKPVSPADLLKRVRRALDA